jgi:hypothetical protein
MSSQEYKCYFTMQIKKKDKKSINEKLFLLDFKGKKVFLLFNFKVEQQNCS